MSSPNQAGKDHSFAYVCILLTVAAKNDWPIFHFDLEDGHLDVPIDEEVCMHVPDGIPSGSRSVMKLNKPIFGTDAAARCWWKLIKSLSTHGYKGTNFNHSVYTLRKGEDTIVMWVDACDGIATASSEQALRTLESLIKKSLEVDWNIRSPRVLDTTIEKVCGGYSLCQRALVDELVREHWDGTSLAYTPLPEGYVPTSSGELSNKRPSEYLSTMQRLAAIATKTRPDMLYGVATMGRFSQKPTVENWNALNHLIRYLARTRKTTLNLTPNGLATEALDCYSDSSWTGPVKLPSIGGYLVRLYECPISWSSHRLCDYAASEFEAELMAVDDALKQALWIRDLVKNVVGASFKIRVNCDSHTAGEVISHGTSRSQMNLSLHPTIRDGHAYLSWVLPSDQVANILTVPLAKKSHAVHSQKILGPSTTS
ncbi:hypothetical protein MJO28_004900 [Puccinia striiformis f. sp. tritici]|uniref:Uncharacterized protein n=1 Tax=Puccinia striiformis f. sp. tritici TaxID=168172 RepID=A0ACC0EJA4_9BASI|nr:hypothetical protein Pst134EA_033368 [Puccinia striiformis f. sp. tritici]KAH9468573.1 hypothetical protein Pst134EA_033368 [Puccinia striiformis f. sp. tritici]KAI7954500.1 hypothetical protein MJO28_004900 [Puccinia striiformis f. sp. tritici]